MTRVQEVFFSFAANVIGREDVADAVRRCPLERILLETDSPYLAFSPWNIIRVAEWVSDVRGMSVSDLLEAVNGNARRFYSLR